MTNRHITMKNPPQHIIITGATGGIGAACTKLFRSRGHAVSTWDIPEVDVTNIHQVTEQFRQDVDKHGPVAALVHCAGVMEPDSATNPQNTRNMTINYGGVVNVCSVVAKHMQEQRAGAIVVVSSNAATTPRIGMASYGASKAAVTAWVRTLALESARFGVRCNVVSPGSTDTPMLRGMWQPDTDQSEQVIAGTPQEYRLGIPLQKLAQPADIAEACAFLISRAAGHITMHDLRVDGGATLDS
ncbi:SDR family oxidoreductase [Corynebacterium matruchotii]|uniref:Putative 2,3-dihydroxybenzoate-2,3-dehydrogenase n=1 Tax=Corynebacterium matruchotii ATCC 33806 TaxID=566549 RepID=C0E0B6_9CORY|nr:SDR family oxidoreductase [Corynebacterium matruchotii]EEG28007.1 putative 2,3-dihydroxybenzoate-2,3-dehydrogenase [Corynebacterium matruchotii ATCC 33806]